MARIAISPAGEITVEDGSHSPPVIGTIAEVATGDGGYVYEATSFDGIKVRGFSPRNTAYRLLGTLDARDGLLARPNDRRYA